MTYERWYRFVASPANCGPPPSVSSRTVPKRCTAGFWYFIATTSLRGCDGPRAITELSDRAAALRSMRAVCRDKTPGMEALRARSVAPESQEQREESDTPSGGNDDEERGRDDEGSSRTSASRETKARPYAEEARASTRLSIDPLEESAEGHSNHRGRVSARAAECGGTPRRLRASRIITGERQGDRPPLPSEGRAARSRSSNRAPRARARRTSKKSKGRAPSYAMTTLTGSTYGDCQASYGAARLTRTRTPHRASSSESCSSSSS